MMAAGPESCAATVAPLPLARTTGRVAALLLLSKPGIVLAETAAGLAGMLLSGNGRFPAATTICWTLAALVMAASGAAMGNCLLDAAFDRQMPRTAARGLALDLAGRGVVCTVALVLTAGSYLIAALFLNPVSLLLLAAAGVSYLFPYTLWLKRSTPWGVFAGGIPGALPPLVGAAAVSGSLPVPSLLLALIIYIWQLPHFWLLALDCREQYARAGIPVLPLTHGEPFTRLLAVAASLLLLPTSLLPGLAGYLSPAYFTVSALVGIIFPLYIARCLYITHDYRRGFIVSQIYLLAIIGAICCEPLIGQW
jgi:protoheme IX farnesyltransferase